MYHVIFYYYKLNIYIFAVIIATFSENPTHFQRIFVQTYYELFVFAASSTTAEDTSGPTDALSSTEKAGTGTPTTSGDVTATLESTTGGK